MSAKRFEHHSLTSSNGQLVDRRRMSGRCSSTKGLMGRAFPLPTRIWSFGLPYPLTQASRVSFIMSKPCFLALESRLDRIWKKRNESSSRALFISVDAIPLFYKTQYQLWSTSPEFLSTLYYPYLWFFLNNHQWQRKIGF